MSRPFFSIFLPLSSLTPVPHCPRTPKRCDETSSAISPLQAPVLNHFSHQAPCHLSQKGRSGDAHFNVVRKRDNLMLWGKKYFGNHFECFLEYGLVCFHAAWDNAVCNCGSIHCIPNLKCECGLLFRKMDLQKSYFASSVEADVSKTKGRYILCFIHLSKNFVKVIPSARDFRVQPLDFYRRAVLWKKQAEGETSKLACSHRLRA